MEKALANGRAFLLLTAGLTIAQARRKRTGILAGNTSSHAAAGVAGHAEPQASSRIHVPGKAGAAYWRQADSTSPSSHWLVSR